MSMKAWRRPSSFYRIGMLLKGSKRLRRRLRRASLCRERSPERESKVYRIRYARQVDKFLGIMSKKDRKLYDRIQNVLDDLEKNPYLSKKLSGEFKDKHSISVGIYRIVYQIHKHELIIFVIDIDHRKDVYRI